MLKGKFGPYVSDGAINATLPEGTEPDSVTMEQALALIAERAAKGGAKKKAAKAAEGRESAQGGEGRKAAKTNGAEKAEKKAAAHQNQNQKESCQARRQSRGESTAKAPTKPRSKCPSWQANRRQLKKDKRPKHTPALDKARVLELLATNAGANKRDLARMLGLKGSDRIQLKRILKELEAEGAIEGRASKSFVKARRTAGDPARSKSPARTTTAKCWPGHWTGTATKNRRPIYLVPPKEGAAPGPGDRAAGAPRKAWRGL